jgi:AcrR family transcriptional regulator
MPRSPKDNQEIRDARREELLRAAARVFAKKGFAHAKISDIAAEADLSHGLVYHYFDSKETIFAAIVDSMMSHVDAELDADEARPPIERIRQSIERGRDRCQHKPEIGRLVAQAMLQGSVSEVIQERLISHVKRLRQRMVGMIADAQEAGEIDADADPGELASALVCLMRGMSIRMPGMPGLPFPLPSTDTILHLLRPTRRPHTGAVRSLARPGRASRGAHAQRARKNG